MNKNEILKETAKRLDDIIKLKGILEWFDGMAIEAGLNAGYEEIENWSDEVALEFLELCQAFNNLHYDDMADQGGDLVAEIVKKIWLAKFKK